MLFSAIKLCGSASYPKAITSLSTLRIFSEFFIKTGFLLPEPSALPNLVLPILSYLTVPFPMISSG